MSKVFSVKIDEKSDLEILIAPAGNNNNAAEAWSIEDDVIEKSSTTLAGALDMVRAIGQCAVDKLSDLDIESAEATVGLKLTGKGKFVVAEIGAEATLSVKFTLRKPK